MTKCFTIPVVEGSCSGIAFFFFEILSFSLNIANVFPIFLQASLLLSPP